MGKCFSCEEPNHSVQNGHTRAPEASRPFNTAANKKPIYATGGGSDVPTQMQQGQNTSSMSESDRKSLQFTPYAKIPPTRKPSSGDSKRLSLSTKEYSETKINTLFDLYKDPNEDVILAEGIEKFCSDLDVKPDEFRVLALAWEFQAENMCQFTRQEFISGCKILKVDSIKGIQSKFPEMLKEVQDKGNFKEFYRWTYKFGLDNDIGQRTLPVDIARALWDLVFSLNEPPILQRWLYFLDQHPCIRGIPKDTWDMFLNFTEAVGDDLTTYDESEAWPSLFDDFVEYENDRQNQNVEPCSKESSKDSQINDDP